MLLSPFKDHFPSFSISFDVHKITPQPQWYPLRSRHSLNSSQRAHGEVLLRSWLGSLLCIRWPCIQSHGGASRLGGWQVAIRVVSFSQAVGRQRSQSWEFLRQWNYSMLTPPWGLRVSRGEMAASTQGLCASYLYCGQRADTSNLREKRHGRWDTVYLGREAWQ